MAELFRLVKYYNLPRYMYVYPLYAHHPLYIYIYNILCNVPMAHHLSNINRYFGWFPGWALAIDDRGNLLRRRINGTCCHSIFFANWDDLWYTLSVTCPFTTYNWLVVTGTELDCFSIYWEESSQLTNSYFSKG